MKYSFKDTIISLFRRIDKAIFDLHRTGKAWKTKKVPHWLVLVFAIGSYLVVLWKLWPFLSNPEVPFFGYLGSFFLLVFTILFLVFAKIYISQLLNYSSPYPIQIKKSHVGTDESDFETPFRYSKTAHCIDYDRANLFKDYLRTDREDFLRLLSGKRVSQKLIWLPLTDRKLPNFRLFFEFLNHISEENLEGYYGENLLRLCNYIISHFESRDMEWSVKQLQKAHSGWKNCNPKRRMDLKIDIENHFVLIGRS